MTVLKRKKWVLDPYDPDSREVGLIDAPNVGDDFFRKMPDDPLFQALNLTKAYRDDKGAYKFLKYELGVPTDIWLSDSPPPNRPYVKAQLPIWSKQREILQALIKHRKVAVKSGHGVGKSWVASVCALYLHYAWHALGITTAPTFRQVRRVLWGEIHRMYNNSPKKLGGVLRQTSLESGDKWFIEGLTTKDPSSAITGFHEENIFVIIDEAGGVAQEVFDAMEGILTSANSFVLLIGNPLDSASAFADAFRPDSEYYNITISCYDSPNVKHGHNIYPKLCTYDWPEKMKKKWGIDSNLFRVRVLGEFPSEGKDTLISVKYLDMAIENYKGWSEELAKQNEELISFGVDVARLGMDSTTVGALWRNKETGIKYFQLLDEYEKQRIDQTTGRIIDWYRKLYPNGMGPVINIDDIGLGGGVTDNLKGMGYPVNGLNVGESPDTWSEQEDKFLNKRAQYYWNLREMFTNQQICIDDDNLAFELSKVGLDFSLKGRIKIEEKKQIRKKLQGKSPDRADCMMLACAEEEELGSQGWIF